MPSLLARRGAAPSSPGSEGYYSRAQRRGLDGVAMVGLALTPGSQMRTVLAVINWCFRPYALLTLGLTPGCHASIGYTDHTLAVFDCVLTAK
jgi:hypothetical protein